MRLFHLVRDLDVSGISGTGVVAEGVEFSDGTVVIRWLSEHASTVVWPHLEAAERVHGHGGATRVVFVDRSAAGMIAAGLRDLVAEPGQPLPPMPESAYPPGAVPLDPT